MVKFSKTNVAIGERVTAARKAAGLSQQEMGDRLGITKGGYGHYERGMHPFSAELLAKLSNILGQSVEYFLGIEGELAPDEDAALTLYRKARERGMGELALRILKDIAGED